MAYGYMSEEDEEVPSPLAALVGIDIEEADDADAPASSLAAPTPRAPSAPSAPAGVAVGKRALTDEELLSKAQRGARHQANMANFGRAMDEISAAFGGYKPDQSYWNNYEKQGHQGVEDFEKLKAVQRLAKQDARQDKLDAQTEALSAARIAEIKRKSGQRYAVLEQTFNLKPGSLNGADPTTVKILADKLRAGELAAATKLAKEEERKWLEGEHAKDRVSRERAAALSAGAKADDKLNSEVEKVGKDLEGTADLKRAFDNIDGALKDSPKDVPGVGWWDTRKPEIFDSTQDTAVKQSLKQIVAKILKKQSGSTVSEDEYARTLAQYGIGKNSTEKAFRQGYAAMKEAAIRGARESEAKQPPEAVKKYRERGGVTSGDFSLEDSRPRRTDPATGETRLWNGTAWVKE